MEKKKSLFFRNLDITPALLRLFQYLPEVYFFIKSKDDVIMAVNQRFAERMGERDPERIVGKSTSDVCPPELAEMYLADDREVMETGANLLDLIELNQASDKSVNWFVTCKVPLYNKDGSIAGIAGIARDIQKTRAALQNYDRFSAVLNYIDDYYSEIIDISELAGMMNMSLSSFERHFKKVFGLSPRQYIMRYRVNKACHKLKTTTKPISAIALETGFYDQSSLTRHFSNYVKMTPSVYRKKFAG